MEPASFSYPQSGATDAFAATQCGATDTFETIQSGVTHLERLNVEPLTDSQRCIARAI